MLKEGFYFDKASCLQWKEKRGLEWTTVDSHNTVQLKNVLLIPFFFFSSQMFHSVIFVIHVLIKCLFYPFFTHPAPFQLDSPAVHLILQPIQPMSFFLAILPLFVFSCIPPLPTLLLLLTSCCLLFPSPTPCSTSYDLSHSPFLWRLLPSESMPLPDADWHHQAPAGLHRGYRRCGCRWRRNRSWRAQCSAKEAPRPLQRRTKQCTHRACKRARGAIPPRPLDDFPGHAMALQVLPLLCHLCWDLVPVWSSLVPGSNGAWRSTR